MTAFPGSFLWGAATAPHQVEGNNISSDWWAREHKMPGMQHSGDANDSYHRYAEDMRLRADAGLNAYRFGIEWARIEPVPGHISHAELAHYRRMIDTALGFGLTPVVTLHHFSSPLWFAEEGGWMGDRSTERFAAYVTVATSILDDVEWVCTINEPNMLAFMVRMMNLAREGLLNEWQSPTVEGALQPQLPDPDPEAGRRLIAAHHAARDILKQRTGASVGWTVANESLVAVPGNAAKLREVQDARENAFQIAARGDHFIGVQAYTSQLVDANGIVPHAPSPNNTMVGTAYRPDAIGIAVRHVSAMTEGVPVLVTENGIATPDDERRIAYTSEALRHVAGAIADGIDVRGYLHWSALDNYEWGHWEPTFGLIADDRETFERRPKPSLSWLGSIARSNGADVVTPAAPDTEEAHK